MRRRHYDPKLGRFLSQDPIGLMGGLNLYSYGANSPVRYVDHTGLNPAIIWGLGAATGVGVYLNETKKYAQQKARDLVAKGYEEGIYPGPPPAGTPRDGSVTRQVLFDKYKHCVVSCQTARKFGGAASWAIGFGHESRAALSPSSTYDQRDIMANGSGIDFACNADSDSDCERKCAQKYPKSYLWQGDLTVLPLEEPLPPQPEYRPQARPRIPGYNSRRNQD